MCLAGEYIPSSEPNYGSFFDTGVEKILSLTTIAPACLASFDTLKKYQLDQARISRG